MAIFASMQKEGRKTKKQFYKLGQIMFGNCTATTDNFFVITMHYIDIILTPTVSQELLQLLSSNLVCSLPLYTGISTANLV